MPQHARGVDGAPPRRRRHTKVKLNRRTWALKDIDLPTLLPIATVLHISSLTPFVPVYVLVS